MITNYEARKLQQDMKPEMNARPATLWKCALGLIALAVFALLGTTSDPRRETGGSARAAGYLEAVPQQPASAAAGGDDREKPHYLGLTKQGQ